MSKPSWDALTKQLRESESPKKRRNACRKLAATHDLAVIPFLRNAYLQDDDERVRDAARDGLVQFKAMQSGQGTRRLPVSAHALSMLARGLAVLFVISLLLNGLLYFLGRNDDSANSSQGTLITGTPTERAALVDQIQARLDETQALTGSLRSEIAHYNETGSVTCDTTYTPPAPLALAAIDKYTYPDLGIVGERVDLALLPLQKALVLLRGACADPAKQTENVIQAATALDSVEAQLKDASALLQTAITNPAPTVGPSPTPLPTRTYTPTVVPTLAPDQPTAIPATPANTLEPTLTPTPTATFTPTPSATPSPSPTATLPFPALDYPSILSEIRSRYAVMADLTNNFKTGMIDQWEQASSASGQSSTSYCQLSTWPTAFTLTPEQQALLDGVTAADPLLEQAITLQSQGLELANQARTLYESSCANWTLASTADQGLALANQALEDLTRSQNVYDAIRARP